VLLDRVRDFDESEAEGVLRNGRRMPQARPLTSLMRQQRKAWWTASVIAVYRSAAVYQA